MTENLDLRTKEGRAAKALLDAENNGSAMTTTAPTPTNAPKRNGKMQLVGTGEGLVAYEKFIIRIGMGTRINAAGREEGTATDVSIMKKIFATKMLPSSAELDNKHAAGCILSAPGNPNETSYWFEAGTVEIGKTYQAETVYTQSKAGAPSITTWKTLKIHIPNQN